MENLKLTIEPLSSFATLIQSDTIFGHFAWTYLELYGEEDFKKNILKPARTIVFSDGFPENCLPYPILKPIQNKAFEQILEKEGIQDIDKKGIYIKKEMKKARFIKIQTLEKAVDNLSNEALIRLFFDKKEDSFLNLEKDRTFFRTKLIYKNSINRLTGTTGEQGGLYSILETFFEPENRVQDSDKSACLDIYVIYDKDYLDQSRIIEVLKVIGINGFGKDKSTGKGKFKICRNKTEKDIKRLKPQKNSNGIISLSTAVACNNINVNYAKVFTKFPKHGGVLASSGKYMKKPALLYRAGSTFKIKKECDVYGKNLELFSKENRDHIHNAHIVPYFVRFKDLETNNG